MKFSAAWSTCLILQSGGWLCSFAVCCRLSVCKGVLALASTQGCVRRHKPPYASTSCSLDPTQTTLAGVLDQGISSRPKAESEGPVQRKEGILNRGSKE